MQGAALDAWEGGPSFREGLRRRAEKEGVDLDEAALDEVARPERYVERLGDMFDRLSLLI